MAVADEHGVALQIARVRPDVLFYALATNLFFALDEEAHVDGEGAAFAHQQLDGLEMYEYLALVVSRAASVDVAVAHRRLEGAALPLVQRIGRLHVIVAVYEQGRLALGV
jgi:hypothetical protein